jgi:uncharacterized phage protein (TIGR01671 family)
MREIKLKAWSKRYKKIWKVIQINFAVEQVLLEDGEWYDYDNLMQYTGLKDKNGKKIYEGDIVNIKHPQDIGGDFGNTNGQVFWDEQEGYWCHSNQSGRPPKRMWEYCEVIGNIYENQELLNKEKK